MDSKRIPGQAFSIRNPTRSRQYSKSFIQYAFLVSGSCIEGCLGGVGARGSATLSPACSSIRGHALGFDPAQLTSTQKPKLP